MYTTYLPVFLIQPTRSKNTVFEESEVTIHQTLTHKENAIQGQLFKRVKLYIPYPTYKTKVSCSWEKLCMYLPNPSTKGGCNTRSTF